MLHIKKGTMWSLWQDGKLQVNGIEQNRNLLKSFFYNSSKVPWKVAFFGWKNTFSSSIVYNFMKMGKICVDWSSIIPWRYYIRSSIFRMDDYFLYNFQQLTILWKWVKFVWIRVLCKNCGDTGIHPIVHHEVAKQIVVISIVYIWDASAGVGRLDRLER